MKIGFDAKRLFNNRSGLGNYSRTLVGQLVRNHPQDSIVLYTPRAGMEVDFTSAPNVRTVFPQGAWRRMGSLWRTSALAGIAAKDGVELYHGLSHELPVGIERTPVRSVVTIHDLIFMRHPEFYSAFDAWMHLRKVRYATRVADAVVAISRQTCKDIVELLGVPEEKIRVVYQSIAPLYTGGLSADRVEEQLSGFDLPKDFVLCVGTIERRKNQGVLLEALRALPEVNLVLVGRRSGRYGQQLDRYIERHGLSSRVRLLSGVSSLQLACLYHRSRFVAYPSIYEGFGLPIVEAMGCGKAVLTSSGGCFSEAGGQGALYVPCRDVRAITETMDRLWRDGELRARLCVEGLRQVQRFSDGDTSERMYALYSELLGRK